MGYLTALWNEHGDPDGSDPPYIAYTPYTFTPIELQQDLGFHRRDVVTVIPALDGVLPAYGHNPSPAADRKWSQTFRVFTSRNMDQARDLLMAQVAPGYPQRLVYVTDGGTQRFTVGTFLDCEATGTRMDRFYIDFKVVWRIRPDWRPRNSQAADLWGSSDGVWGTNDGVWGGGFNTVALNNTTGANLALDNTGDTALGTMPTLDDTGPLITLGGPYGGDPDATYHVGGLRVVNTSVYLPDTNGVLGYAYFDLPYKMSTPADGYTIDCRTQAFTFDGGIVRPSKPAWQPYFMMIRAGIVNNFVVYPLGINFALGNGTTVPYGFLTVDWWRKWA